MEERPTATALVQVREPSEYQGLVMHCSPAEAHSRMLELQAFVEKAMVKDVDFGLIPGTQRPCLYQPGAQKLCEMYGLTPKFVFDEKVEDWDRGFFYYVARCTLSERRTGAFVGDGIGSCNSKEKKYAGRWVTEDKVPGWLDKATLKKRDAVEWLWRSKIPQGTDVSKLPTQERQGKDGKYTVWGVPSTQFFVPNEDICDLVNTFQKMACKRALMHAVLGVTRSGGVFGQDLEDLPPEVVGQVEEKRSWERISAEPPTAAEEEATARAAAAKKAAEEAAAKLEEKAVRFRAIVSAAQTRAAFKAAWEMLKADPEYKTLSEDAQLRALYQEKSKLPPPAKEVPAAPAPAAAQPTEKKPAPAGKKPAVPLEVIAEWTVKIDKCPEDEKDALFDSLNDTFEGDIPLVLVETYTARFPD